LGRDDPGTGADAVDPRRLLLATDDATVIVVVVPST
jgi:hypothetical protein